MTATLGAARPRVRRALVFLAVLAAIAAAGLAATRPVPIGADEVPAEVTIEADVRFPAYGPTGLPRGSVAWNVVTGTGNCCENLIRVGDDGTIYDFGGSKLKLSRDGGTTWTLVDSAFVVSGEGDLAIAPNGDVLAMTWDPYSGDRIQAVRYLAAEGTWQFAEVPLNTPFYDRPWLAITPTSDDPSDYRVVIRSGYSLNPGFLISDDGLVFRPAQRATARTAVADWSIAPRPFTGAARAQAHAEAQMVPLGDGRLLLGDDLDSLLCASGVHVLEVNGTFTCLAARPDRQVTGWDVSDGRGRLYGLRWDPNGDLEVAVSADGGRTTTVTALPTLGREVRSLGDVDLKTDQHGTRVVVAAHVIDPADGTSDFLVYDLRRHGSRLAVQRVLELGDGDGVFQTSAGGTGDRVDFPTIGLLPDGRIVASFRDVARGELSLAIERHPG